MDGCTDMSNGRNAGDEGKAKVESQREGGPVKGDADVLSLQVVK